MTVRLQTLTLGAALALLAACAATTTFDSTWKAPNVQVSPVGKTIVAVFVSKDVSQRRAAEDAMVAALGKRGAHGVAAYTLLAEDYKGGDPQAAEDRFKQTGANAVVVMRMVGKDQKVTYTPGAPAPAAYGRFGPYWGYGWGAAYDPGYLSTDTLVSVETTIYSLDREELIWASTSRTTNPTDVKSLVSEIAEATANEMVLQGILAPK